MENTPSSYALMKSFARFPEFVGRRAPNETAPKPTYPIEHRSRRSN